MDGKTDNGVAREIETVDRPSRPPRKRRCLTHCKRFWWIYLLVVIAIVVLVVCLVIFVGLPKIAQDKLDDAKLEIQGVDVLDTKSDSYHMSINSTITTDGKIHADIDAFVGDMYLEDTDEKKPFVALDFPQTSAEKYLEVNISQEVSITDMEAFTRFNVWFTHNETLRVTIKGDTHAKAAGLSRKYGVTFKKTVEMKGLSGFKGLEVTDGRIDLKKDSDGNNFWGKAKIPNPSHFTLDIGNVTFTNYIGDTDYGTITIDNLLLKPGDNVFDVKGSLEQSGILTLVRSPQYCETGMIPFKMLGRSVDNHGQDLSYFATALGSANQTVEVDIGKIIKDSLNVDIKCSGS